MYASFWQKSPQWDDSQCHLTSLAKPYPYQPQPFALNRQIFKSAVFDSFNVLLLSDSSLLILPFEFWKHVVVGRKYL
jgi:hypothetical protein